MTPLSFPTSRTARYYSLGEAGPAIQEVWFCLGAHGQPTTELAAQLANLDTPERLLILPEGLSRFEVATALVGGASEPPGAAPLAPYIGSAWFASDSLLLDLTDLTLYLDALAGQVLAACPPDTPVTVLGCGHGAAAACRWLAGGRVPYERLLLYAAMFPPDIDRRATFVALPERPVLIISTTTETYSPEVAGEGLLQDCLSVGLPARLSYVDAGPLTLAALGAGSVSGPPPSAAPAPDPTK